MELLELVHFSLERARASAPRLRAAPGPALGLGRRVCKGITARPARLSHRHPHLPAAEGRRLETREGDASLAMGLSASEGDASLAMGLSASEADALALAHRMRAGLAHQTRDRWWRDLRFYRQCFLGADAVQVRVRNQTVETVASQSRQSLVHVLGLLIRFPGNDGPGGYRQCPRPGT